MNKQAYIEEVYNSAFNDELEKIALKGLGEVTNKLTSRLSSFIPGIKKKRKMLFEAVKKHNKKAVRNLEQPRESSLLNWDEFMKPAKKISQHNYPIAQKTYSSAIKLMNKQKNIEL